MNVCVSVFVCMSIHICVYKYIYICIYSFTHSFYSNRSAVCSVFYLPHCLLVFVLLLVWDRHVILFL